MRRIFRGRLGRSRSKGGLIETAFVSQTQSSTEDLDEVDRLANHPVLRPSSSSQWHRLRKSRSETGGSVDRGLAPWTGDSNQSSPMAQTISMTSSSAASGFGSRLVQAGALLKKRTSKKPISKMKRSYTVDFAAAQAEDSPQSLPKPRYDDSSHREEDSQSPPLQDHDCDIPVRRSSNHLVTAIIESNHNSNTTSRECCVSPPASSHYHAETEIEHDDTITKIDEEQIEVQDPPNTAPLPSKFGGGCVGGINAAMPPHNLLRLQIHKKSLIDCDTSSAASESVMSPKTNNITKLNASSCGPQLKMSLPLKQRLRVVDISSQEDSSSTDSTPQRRKVNLMNNASDSKTKKSTLATTHHKNHHHHPNGSKVITKPPAPILSRKMKPQSRFFLNLSGESESCSSAMSSMESVRSSNSDGGSVQSLVSSSESGAGCSMSSNSNSNLSIPNCPKPTLELRTHRSNILSSSKFQVLSPISDKSQEQSSEQGDSSSRTPKVSPTDHILTSCCGVVNTDDNENNNPPLLLTSLSASTEISNNTTPAPFSMPKLQRRLAQQSSQQHHKQDPVKYYQNSLLKRANSGIQGSDSGISMSSQDVELIHDLLKLPFDMPKLRRKTQHILARPHSMPIQQDQHHQQQHGGGAPSIEHFQENISNSASNLQKHDIKETSWPGPKPTETGSTMDNYQHYSSSNKNWQFNEIPSGNIDADEEDLSAEKAPACFSAKPKNNTTTEVEEEEEDSLAPPPPGFSDENNQFYLTETCNYPGEDMELVPGLVKGHQKLSIRRRRPQMTLSFGVDPKEKTLMFATNSPFLLNDCQDIDPALPLEKQEWYHGAITKLETEELLRSQEEGSYLVRNVDLLRQEFSLILKSAKGFMHMRIKRDTKTREFQLSDFERKFVTIPEMVYHYTRNRLPIKGAEHMCLKKPIPIQLL